MPKHVEIASSIKEQERILAEPHRVPVGMQDLEACRDDDASSELRTSAQRGKDSLLPASREDAGGVCSAPRHAGRRWGSTANHGVLSSQPTHNATKVGETEGG